MCAHGFHFQALNVLAKQLVNVRKQKTRTYSAQSKVRLFFYHLYIEIPNFNEFVLENYFESRKFDIKYQVQAVGSASKVRILKF